MLIAQANDLGNHLITYQSGDMASSRQRTVRELVLLGDGGLDLRAQADLRAEHEVRAVVHQNEVRLRAEESGYSTSKL